MPTIKDPTREINEATTLSPGAAKDGPAQAPARNALVATGTAAPARRAGLQEQDDDSPGAVFVRDCPECGVKRQTADGSGKEPCRVCKAKAKQPEAKAAETEAKPSPEVARADVDASEASGSVLADDVPPVLAAPAPEKR